MKYKLLLILLFTNLLYSQTNHQLNWNMSSTNQQITIAVDDTVTWTWGSGTHNLRSTGGVEMFDSGYHGPGYQFSHTFTIPGVTTYICDPHPNSMYGTITVTATASVIEQGLFNFNISPVPASDIINISLDNVGNDQISIEVYDLLGRQKYEYYFKCYKRKNKPKYFRINQRYLCVKGNQRHNNFSQEIY